MSGEADSEDRVNMVPLIDTMFFLILFFMLITKFAPDEKAIASLLPTDKGQGVSSSKHPQVLEQVNIAVYPGGMRKGMQPSEYRNAMKQQEDDKTFNQVVYLRVGGSEPIEILGQPLSIGAVSSAPMREQVARVHAYIAQELESREKAGAAARKDQSPVVVHCFSQLSWKYALLAYDAVRAFETTKPGGILNKDNADLHDAREVSMAPPRIRNYNFNELGNEIYEIVHLR